MRKRSTRMSRPRRLAMVGLAAGLATAAAACSSTPSGPAGFVEVGESYAVAMDPRWTDVTYEMGVGHRSVRFFTWDGPRLNQLFFAGDLPEGEALVRGVRGAPRPPAHSPRASSGRQAAFVAGTLTALGYRDVQIDRPQEQVFARFNARRFDFRAATSEGLLVTGLAVMADGRSGLNAALFVAPTEHYAAARLPEVERIIASATREF